MKAIFLGALLVCCTSSVAAALEPDIDLLEENLLGDFLERVCHPYSDIGLFFDRPDPKSAPRPDRFRRVFSLPALCESLAIRGERGELLKTALRTAGVAGVEVEWTRGLGKGPGSGMALRLQRATVRTLIPGPTRGVRLERSRSFVTHWGDM
jgi:hypothetical protein